MKALICVTVFVVSWCNGMQTMRLRTPDGYTQERISVPVWQEEPSSLSTSVYDGLIECVICTADSDEEQLISIPCTHTHTELICAICLDKLTSCPLCRSPLKAVDEEVSCCSWWWAKL